MIRQLSPRQFAILSWAAAGKTNVEIASILPLSRKIIERELTEIYSLLEVEHRFGAASMFLSWTLHNKLRASR